VFTESWQLIIKRINIPAIVKVNDTGYIVLDCDYDFENTSSKGLVVKWFFNTNQLVYQWIYGRYPQADEPAAKYVDLTYKASNDPYTEYRAIKLNKPGVDLTGEYTCVISTYADEQTANASMIVYSPHFEYCATLLIDMSKTQLTKLQVAQNRAIRVILQCVRYTIVEKNVASAVVYISQA
ncbi:PREDICTED: uncharacterized protein LOC105458871, partial [Wasmannia auropunctata]|uniref:uncharacterized protein LOC105458871 n=1 Tax=Wasmannia auropunctata TaxID=64793 RepID=UPI0005EE7AA4